MLKKNMVNKIFKVVDIICFIFTTFISSSFVSQTCFHIFFAGYGGAGGHRLKKNSVLLLVSQLAFKKIIFV